jgi:hypothetical protein
VDGKTNHSRTNHSSFWTGVRIHHLPANEVCTPSGSDVCAREGCDGRIPFEQLLDSTSLLVLRGGRVVNPDFYPMLRGLGFKNLPDQSAMTAITFCDVVVSHEAFSDGLLFHKLVHVEQYRQLGIPRFSELYVRRFLNAGCYEAIPLEVNAYTLSGRFEANPCRPFSVEDQVRKWHTERMSRAPHPPKGNE